jgi:hypothetical protein
MRAKVTSAFNGMTAASTEPELINPGTELTDSYAWYAVEAGVAEWLPNGKPSGAQEDVMRSSPRPKHYPQPVKEAKRKAAA